MFFNKITSPHEKKYFVTTKRYYDSSADSMYYKVRIGPNMKYGPTQLKLYRFFCMRRIILFFFDLEISPPPSPSTG